MYYTIFIKYIYVQIYTTRFNKQSTCFDNLGLDLNMSFARLTARKMRVTRLKYLIKALDSYGMLIMSLKAVYALVVGWFIKIKSDQIITAGGLLVAH